MSGKIVIDLKDKSENLRKELASYLSSKKINFKIWEEGNIFLLSDFPPQFNFKALKRFLEDRKIPFSWIEKEEFYLPDLKKVKVSFQLKGEKFSPDSFSWWIGPCSVDTEENLRSIASVMEKWGCRILRGGAYKPRTYPQDFQGMGKKGLEILRSVADEFNLLVVSELVSLQKLDEFLEKVDIIQVGARNMYNYPMLKELSQIDKPVLLKRHFGATREELCGSLEYLLSGSNKKVIVCERGIRTFSGELVDLNTAFYLKDKFQIPVILDLTHSATKSSHIVDLARAFIHLPFNGLMLEVHPSPVNSPSEADRILSLEQLEAILSFYAK